MAMETREDILSYCLWLETQARRLDYADKRDCAEGMRLARDEALSRADDDTFVAEFLRHFPDAQDSLLLPESPATQMSYQK